MWLQEIKQENTVTKPRELWVLEAKGKRKWMVSAEKNQY